MSIYITGDIHGEPKRLGSKNLLRKGLNITEGDVVIICGDFGMPWNNPWSEEETYWLEWLSKKPFTVLFVDGNHENYDLLNQFPIVEKFGGKVHQLKENIFHLMRGEVFEIEGTTFFAFGGATSTDMCARKEHISWWKEENFSIEEFDNAVTNLKKVNFSVDYVITHTAPKRFVESVPGAIKRVRNCKTSMLLSELETMIDYKKWFFGHFHLDYYREDSVAAWMSEEIIMVESNIEDEEDLLLYLEAMERLKNPNRRVYSYEKAMKILGVTEKDLEDVDVDMAVNNMKEKLFVNKEYLKAELPEFLQKDIDALVEGRKNKVSYVDCLEGEVYGSINGAYYDGSITNEQAAYLRKKYLGIEPIESI